MREISRPDNRIGVGSACFTLHLSLVMAHAEASSRRPHRNCAWEEDRSSNLGP